MFLVQVSRKYVLAGGSVMTLRSDVGTFTSAVDAAAAAAAHPGAVIWWDGDDKVLDAPWVRLTAADVDALTVGV